MCSIILSSGLAVSYDVGIGRTSAFFPFSPGALTLALGVFFFFLFGVSPSSGSVASPLTLAAAAFLQRLRGAPGVLFSDFPFCGDAVSRYLTNSPEFFERLHKCGISTPR